MLEHHALSEKRIGFAIGNQLKTCLCVLYCHQSRHNSQQSHLLMYPRLGYTAGDGGVRLIG
ncbi:hypothetical protein D3C85_1543900 [compost metagenome]